MSAVYQVPDIAALTDTADWTIYQSVRDGSCPFPVLRIGRRIVFPKAPVDQLLGLDPPPDSNEPPEAHPATDGSSVLNRKAQHVNAHAQEDVTRHRT